jgi:autotransporter-associated beta strand protein
LSAATTVALGGGGILDIGANNQTIGGLTFVNQNAGFTYGNHYGVIGAGTLRVAGEINVVGDLGGNNTGNAIDSNLDLGGGTQTFRVAVGSFFAGPSTMMVTGVISNGSLLKTIGYNSNGALVTSSDGIGLFGNNTYTGSTTINGGSAAGFSLTAGTNASTSLKVVNSFLSIIGANGSYGSANGIQVVSGGSLTLDNNASFATGINAGAGPPISAANNNNRISDTAALTMRDGNLTYRGLTGVASSETYGSMNITGGHNTIAIAPTGAGTATFAATGNLTMDPRSTLQISASSTVLGTTGFVKFGGTVPAPVGGIIPRVVSTSDFVTYDATNGFTPLPAASYQSSYVAGANVALSAATSTNTVAINAVKTTASLTTTINSGQTLTVNSGMMFATSGTHTVSGGILDFGSTPGVLIGSHTINSAVTGSQGLLASGSGTVTLAGDLTGLSGTLSNIGTGTLTLSGTAANYAGALEVRRGTLNINASSAGGPITIGVSANDSSLLPANPVVSISGAGAGSTIARDIVVDNGATNAAGAALNRSTLLPTLTALSNTTGSQTLSGNITLNTTLNHSASIGTTSTGATNYNGNISGPATLLVNAGRVNLNGNYSNAGGVIAYASGGGNTAIVNFNGTASGNAPIVISAGSNSQTGIGYSSQSNLFSGPITVDAAGFFSLPTIRVLANSSISNPVNMPARPNVGTANGGVNVDVAAGATGTWTGPVTGAGSITKVDTGTFVMTNSGNTYTGNTTVSAGTLRLDANGSFANSPTITVGTSFGPILDVSTVSGGPNYNSSLNSFSLAISQRLKGSGTVSGKTAIPSGAFLAPGNSVGTITFDSNTTIAGTLEIEATSPSSVDLLQLTGAAGLTLTGSSVLALAPTNTYDGVTPLTIAQTTGGLISGQFGSIQNLPNGYNVVYGSSSIMIAPVPEPGSLILGGFAAATGLGIWRRKRKASATN